MGTAPQRVCVLRRCNATQTAHTLVSYPIKAAAFSHPLGQVREHGRENASSGHFWCDSIPPCIVAIASMLNYHATPSTVLRRGRTFPSSLCLLWRPPVLLIWGDIPLMLCSRQENAMYLPALVARAQPCGSLQVPSQTNRCTVARLPLVPLARGWTARLVVWDKKARTE
jgi:hypothetical protein